MVGVTLSDVKTGMFRWSQTDLFIIKFTIKFSLNGLASIVGHCPDSLFYTGVIKWQFYILDIF